MCSLLWQNQIPLFFCVKASWSPHGNPLLGKGLLAGSWPAVLPVVWLQLLLLIPFLSKAIRPLRAINMIPPALCSQWLCPTAAYILLSLRNIFLQLLLLVHRGCWKLERDLLWSSEWRNVPEISRFPRRNKDGSKDKIWCVLQGLKISRWIAWQQIMFQKWFSKGG